MGRALGLPKFKDIKLDGNRWPDFTSEEMGCRNGNHPNRTTCHFCGGDYFHSPDFLDCLQSMRTRLGHPVVINSAHRCRQSELAVGGAMGHHRRVAADVLILNNDRFEMLRVARHVGFSGIGLYCSFIHLDLGRKRQWYGRGAKGLWKNV